MREVTIIGAATSAGSYGPGQERTPQVLRERGLLDAVAAVRPQPEDLGDVASGEHGFDPDNPRLRRVETIARVNDAVAGAVGPALRRDSDVVVIGGDCTIQLGVVAGIRTLTDRVGVLYLDLDADLNTPETTDDGAGDWMGVAHLLDVDGADERMAQVRDVPRPLLGAEDVTLVGADNVTPAESVTIDRLGLARFTTADLRADTEGFLAWAADWAGQKDVVSVHVDTDILDQTRFPVAENDRNTPGLTFDELHWLVTALCALPRTRILTICEINPDKVDTTDRLDAMVRLIADALAAGSGREPIANSESV